MKHLAIPVAILAAVTQLAAQETRRLNLEERSIPAGSVTYRVQTGRLHVPENRSDPESRTINVAFARLRSEVSDPRPPLIYLAGGPGNDATSMVTSPYWAPYLGLCDVILLDQRGIGRSQPQLVWPTDEMRPAALFGDEKTATEHILEIASKAREHHRAQGIDLSGYTTTESAADIEDLRRALGLARVSLMGHSYGTHLGLEVIRRFGEHIDRFVSIGTAGTGDMHKLPSELDESLRRVSAVVAADERIGEDMPDFYGLFERLLDELEREPMQVTVIDPRDKREVTVAVGRFGLQMILVMDLGDTADLPVLPRLLHSIDRGDPTLLRWFVQKRYSQFSVFPTVFFAMRGASGATARRWERIAKEASVSPFGMVRMTFSPGIDRALQTPDLGDAFRAPVESEVPALFISGTLDANTPPHQAERVRAGFPHSAHLVVTNAGHEDLLFNPEVEDRILRFLGGEAPDATRIEAPELRFALLQGPDPEVSHPALQSSRR